MKKTATCKSCKKYDKTDDICTLEPFEGQYTTGCPKIDRTVGFKITMAIMLLIITGVLWMLHPILGAISLIMTVLMLFSISENVATMTKVAVIVAVTIFIGVFIFAGDSPESDMQSTAIEALIEEPYGPIVFKDGTRIAPFGFDDAMEIRDHLSVKLSEDEQCGLVEVWYGGKTRYFIWVESLGVTTIWLDLMTDENIEVMYPDEFKKYFPNATYLTETSAVKEIPAEQTDVKKIPVEQPTVISTPIAIINELSAPISSFEEWQAYTAVYLTNILNLESEYESGVVLLSKKNEHGYATHIWSIIGDDTIITIPLTEDDFPTMTKDEHAREYNEYRIEFVAPGKGYDWWSQMDDILNA